MSRDTYIFFYFELLCMELKCFSICSFYFEGEAGKHVIERRNLQKEKRSFFSKIEKRSNSFKKRRFQIAE